MTPNPTLAAKMRASAESGLAAANERIAELKARKPNTYKRVNEAKGQLKDEWTKWMAATTLASLADAAEAGTLPQELATLKTWNAVQRKFSCADEHRKVLDPFIPERPTDELLFKVWDLVGSKIPGYFPTPLEVINQLMGHYADPLEGVRVLEPSAGSGNIADWLRESGALVDCAEANYTLHEILTLKGHSVIGRDALEIAGQWPLIVMNPPFEKLQDAEHVRHAFEHNLAPGGTLLAIIGGGTLTGSSKKHLEFQQWFRSLGGHWDRLPAGAFEESGTNVSTTMIVLQKPDEEKDDDDPTGTVEPELVRTASLQELPPHERPLNIAATPEPKPEEGIIPMLIGASKARRLRWWTEEFGDRTDEMKEQLGRDPDPVEEYDYMSLIAMHARADSDDRRRMLAEVVAFAIAKKRPVPLEVRISVLDAPGSIGPTNLPTEATEAPERAVDTPARPLLEGRPMPVPDDLPGYAVTTPEDDPYWTRSRVRYRMSSESVDMAARRVEAGIGLSSGTGRYPFANVIQWHGTLWVCVGASWASHEETVQLWRIVPVAEPDAQKVLAALPEKRQGYHGVVLGRCNARGALITPQWVMVGPPVEWVYNKADDDLQTGSSPELAPETEELLEGVPTLVFVGCSASKKDCTGRAADIYTGELFKLQRTWALGAGYGISPYILSAKYGLLSFGNAISPYEATLDTAEKRRAWDELVLGMIRDGRNHLGASLHLPYRDKPARVIVMAGENYRGWIDETRKLAPLWRFEVPLQGLGIGEQKAALGRMIDQLNHDKHGWPPPVRDERWNRSLAAIKPEEVVVVSDIAQDALPEPQPAPKDEELGTWLRKDGQTGFLL